MKISLKIEIYKGKLLMLIRFNVKNVFSFSSKDDGTSEEFSMIAGKVRRDSGHVHDDGKLKLLKFAALYGANASGKSNLVKAMDLMRRIVVYRFPEGITDKYCRTEDENRDRPSYFEVEIMLGEKYYAYGFEIILSQRRFTSEWLVELNADGSEREIFVIDREKSTYSLSGEINRKDLRGRLEIYAEDISRDTSSLFLTYMNDGKDYLYSSHESLNILREVFLWIKNSLCIIYPDQMLSSYEYLSVGTKTGEISSFLTSLGTGITGFDMVEIPAEQALGKMNPSVRGQVADRLDREMKKLDEGQEESTSISMRTRRDFFIFTLRKGSPSVYCSTVRFSHGKNGSLFSLDEESDGTVRILDLIEILIGEEGKTFVLDELDRCLHPMLSYKFVETFLQIAEKRRIQLIVTTHESRLMDFDLLRRDEIWFVEKKSDGSSDLYSLEEYNTRFDQKIDKAYLDGRYGGVPVFSTVFPVGEEIQ